MNPSNLHLSSRTIRFSRSPSPFLSTPIKNLYQHRVQWQQRTFATKSPGRDPLELLRQASEKRGFCGSDGIRKKDVHWTFALATSGVNIEAPPSLRTIDFQRITPSGIDFIRKRGRGLSDLTSSNKVSSILCSFGKYRTGEKVEQWVAEGHCVEVNEDFDLLKVVPERSIVELVASRLVKEEGGLTVEDDHSSMDAVTHYLEIVQKTRNRLESGELARDELNKSIMFVRFVPTRMERYIGGPDQAMWDRWEWKRVSELWDEPIRLLY